VFDAVFVVVPEVCDVPLWWCPLDPPVVWLVEADELFVLRLMTALATALLLPPWAKAFATTVPFCWSILTNAFAIVCVWLLKPLSLDPPS